MKAQWLTRLLFVSVLGLLLLAISLLMLVTQGCGAVVSTLSYRIGGTDGQALVCIPEGKGPFPAVVYNHGIIVDNVGYQRAAQRGYNLNGICQALAADGFLAFAPLRKSGKGDIPRHKQEVLQALDYVKRLPEADPSRIALMGFSRGGLLTLMVGVERKDLKALLVLAPAPGEGHFAETVKHTASINAPVLLLVEAGDDAQILENFDMLERALKSLRKELRSIRYTRGGGHQLFWNVGYYWDDVRAFLREKLGGTTSR
ncbi:MAG: dienelactone hydrolase family protein [Deltaproteobacteria bacterium]|nr:dienelactone hydrolase family protein [Deltaproteobacteria bacterium]